MHRIIQVYVDAGPRLYRTFTVAVVVALALGATQSVALAAGAQEDALIKAVVGEATKWGAALAMILAVIGVIFLGIQIQAGAFSGNSHALPRAFMGIGMVAFGLLLVWGAPNVTNYLAGLTRTVQQNQDSVVNIRNATAP